MWRDIIPEAERLRFEIRNSKIRIRDRNLRRNGEIFSLSSGIRKLEWKIRTCVQLFFFREKIAGWREPAWRREFKFRIVLRKGGCAQEPLFSASPSCFWPFFCLSPDHATSASGCPLHFVREEDFNPLSCGKMSNMS